jgi:hypothetical protein
VSEERELPGSITFYFDDVLRSISLEEASMLSHWLHKTRVLAAGTLAQRLDEEVTTNAEDRTGIELDSGARVVLRDLLTNVDLSKHARLKGLAQTLQSEIWNKPLEAESTPPPSDPRRALDQPG